MDRSLIRFDRIRQYLGLPGIFKPFEADVVPSGANSDWCELPVGQPSLMVRIGYSDRGYVTATYSAASVAELRTAGCFVDELMPRLVGCNPIGNWFWAHFVFDVPQFKAALPFLPGIAKLMGRAASSPQPAAAMVLTHPRFDRPPVHQPHPRRRKGTVSFRAMLAKSHQGPKLPCA